MKRILLISTNAIGDTYIVCSAFLPLKELFPDSKIDIVSLESSQFFLKKIRFNKLFLLKEKSYSEVVKYLRKIRQNKYDLVFNFFPGQVNSFFFQFSSAVKKAGFRNLKKVKDWHDEDDAVTTIPGKSDSKFIWKKTDNFLLRIQLPLNAAGIEISELKKPIIETTSSTENNHDIILHPFSSDERKSIPTQKISEILTKLSENLSKKVCLIGNADEIKPFKSLNSNPNITYIEYPEIEETIDIMKNASLFIGVDSFPLHIADAHSIKTLGIFTCTNENSVLQDMENKFIFRIKDMDRFKSSDLIDFMKNNNL